MFIAYELCMTEEWILADKKENLCLNVVEGFYNTLKSYSHSST